MFRIGLSVYEVSSIVFYGENDSENKDNYYYYYFFYFLSFFADLFERTSVVGINHTRACNTTCASWTTRVLIVRSSVFLLSLVLVVSTSFNLYNFQLGTIGS